jgi:hypothetical protein
MHKVVPYFPFRVLGWGFLADARFGADGCWDLGVGRFELHPALEFGVGIAQGTIFASVLMASGLLGSSAW